MLEKLETLSFDCKKYFTTTSFLATLSLTLGNPDKNSTRKWGCFWKMCNENDDSQEEEIIIMDEEKNLPASQLRCS